MKTKTRFHKLTAWLLTLAMLMTFIPSFTLSAFAADNLCEHHTEHTAECGYVEGVSECTYACEESHEEEPSEEPAPVCDCGTDDPAIHAVSCAVYVAPENPQCFCVEKCTAENFNEYCDVCGFDYSKCGGADTASAYDLAQDENGVYLIATVDELYAFAALVNGGNVSINGKLTANIEVNQGTMTAASTNVRAWTPIGNNSNKYAGTFDGADYTISGLYVNDNSADYIGLFGYVGTGGTVQNVGVINSYISGKSYIGGVAGLNQSNVMNCYNTGAVSGDSNVGGVVGLNRESNSIVMNCYNTGAVTGDSKVGGVVGYNRASGSTITNCYNIGAVTGNTNTGSVLGYLANGHVTNCYYLSGTAKNDWDIGYPEKARTAAVVKNATQFASGEVAYLLQQGCTVGEGDGAATYSGDAWGQDLDNGKPHQTAPTFNGAKVYRYYVFSADDAEWGYTNDPNVTTEKPSSYTVTIAETSNGTVNVGRTTASEGDTVTLTITPAEGYELDTLTVKDADNNDITVTDNKFTMPATDVTVTATFKAVTAAETHSHDMSVACGNDDPMTFNVWDGTTDFPSGNVYLTDNVTLTESLIISSGTVNLCLNGHTITITNSQDAFYVESGATLNICDCSTNQSGKIEKTSASADYPGILNRGGTVNVYSGTVSSSNNSNGIYNYSGTVNVYSGTVSSSQRYGINNKGTVNVYGGTVSGIYSGINNKGTVNVYGGTVSSSYSYGIYNDANLNIYGGTVSGISSGINNGADGEITVSGGTVTSEGDAGTGIYNYGEVTVSGGTVKSTGADGNNYGIYCNTGTLNLSGAPTITGTTADINLEDGIITIDEDGLSNITPYAVKTGTNPTEDAKVKIVAANETDYSAKFAPVDKDSFTVVRESDNCLYLDIIHTVSVTDVTLDKNSINLYLGKTDNATLTATVEPADATNKAVTWSSDDKDVATVDQNGVITAVGKGYTKITATAADGSGVSDSLYVYVNEKIESVIINVVAPVAGGTVNGSNFSVDEGQPYYIHTTSWNGTLNNNDTNVTVEAGQDYQMKVVLAGNYGYFDNDTMASIKIGDDIITEGVELKTSATPSTCSVEYTFNIPPTKYNVTFDTNGGTINSGNMTSYIAGEETALPTDVEKEGHSFAGWYEDENFTGSAVARIESTDTGDKEYFAKWTVNKYPVTFNAGDGAFADGSKEITIDVELGTIPAVPEVPVRAGYVFAGWEPALTPVTVNGATYTATYVPDNVSYTIEIYTMDITGKYGEPEKEPKTAETDSIVSVTPEDKEGFTVDTNASILEKEVAADGSTTLKVYYSRNRYNFTVEVDGVKDIKPYYYGEAVEAPTAPTKTGYTFDGWDIEIPATMPAEDVSITAQWTLDTPTISAVSGYSGKYDGKSHEISVTVSTVSDFDYSYQWYEGGKEEANKIAGAASAEYAVKNNADSGTYYCKVKATDGSQTQTVWSGAVTALIEKRSVTLTSATDQKEFDGTPLENNIITITADGFVSGEGAEYDVTGTQKYVGFSENAFTYALTTGTNADNYTITTESGTLTVTNRTEKYQISVEANSGTFEYNNAEHTVSGLKQTVFEVEGNSYTVSGLTATAFGTDAAIIPVTISGSAIVKDKNNVDVTDQFDIKTINGTLTITKATANEITGLAIEGWTFGESAKTPSASATFGTPAFTYVGTGKTNYAESTTPPSNVGTYKVIAKVADTENFVGASYEKEFAIAKATPTYTAPTAILNLEYDGSAKALVNAGTANGGTMQYSLDGTTWSVDIPAGTNANTYTVYYKVVGDANHDDNEVGTVQVTIAKATPVVTAPVAADGLVYNGTAQKLATAGSTTAGILKYSIDNANWIDTIPEETNAANYTVYYKVIGDENYNDVVAQSISVSIAKADSTATPPTANTLTYNTSAQTLVTAGIANGGQMQYSLNGTTWSADIPAGTNANTYTVYYKVVGDANHDDNAGGSVSVTIGKADKTAPEVAGVDETIKSKADGRITGVDDTMEYRKQGDANYIAITADTVENLAAGTYLVRYKETENYFASSDKQIVIADGVMLTIAFNSNEGTSVDSVTCEWNQTITAPTEPTKDGFEFISWYLDDTLTTEWTNEYQFTADTTLYAKWVHGTVSDYEDHVDEVEANGLNDVAKTEGTDITLVVQVEEATEGDSEQTAIKGIADVPNNFGFYDITLEKSSGGYVTNASSVIEIKLPYDFTRKTNIKVYRYHSGVSEELAQLDARATASYVDGKCCVDKSNNCIYIYSSKFSTYAVAYDTVRSSSGGGTTRYTVKFDTNGGSSVSSATVTKNAKVAEPKTPEKDGYTFGGWYTDKEFAEKYDFESKVTKNFTLYAKWDKHDDEQSSTDTHNCPSLAFDDLDITKWYHLDTDYVIENGIFKGTTETTFEPDSAQTRAMMVTVLYRAESEPAVNRNIPFADVDMGAYYANAVIWGQQNGIIKGYSETEFGPDDKITREQIAAIMHRYAQYKGIDVSVGENTNILSYDDFDSISEYAIPSMQWAVGSGLIKGKSESTLNPLDNATRAEIAAILHRFIEANK